MKRRRNARIEESSFYDSDFTDAELDDLDEIELRRLERNYADTTKHSYNDEYDWGSLRDIRRALKRRNSFVTASQDLDYLRIPIDLNAEYEFRVNYIRWDFYSGTFDGFKDSFEFTGTLKELLEEIDGLDVTSVRVYDLEDGKYILSVKGEDLTSTPI